MAKYEGRKDLDAIKELCGEFLDKYSAFEYAKIETSNVRWILQSVCNDLFVGDQIGFFPDQREDIDSYLERLVEYEQKTIEAKKEYDKECLRRNFSRLTSL